MIENETEKREAMPTNVLLTLCIKSQFLHLGIEDSNIGLYQCDKNEKALLKVYLKFCKYNTILIQQVSSPEK